MRDIYPLLFREHNAAGHRRLRDNLFPILEHVDHIIAISHYTKKELLQHLGVEAGRVTVIHHGVDTARFRPRPPSALEDVRRRYSFPRPYMLYVAALDPRKNIAP